MPKAFSEIEKETIRSQMREKGKKLFEQHGLKKTSVDELTEAVGISKGAFYLFYESKEELLMEILEQIEKEIQTSILEFAVQSKTPQNNPALQIPYAKWRNRQSVFSCRFESRPQSQYTPPQSATRQS